MSYALHLNPPAAGLPSDTNLRIEAVGNRAVGVRFAVEDIGQREEDATTGITVEQALPIIAQQGGDVVARTLAFALAVERQRLTPNLRAGRIRLIAAELERARRHATVVAAMLDTIGAEEWREQVAISYHVIVTTEKAVFPPTNVPLITLGGVSSSIADAELLVGNIVRLEGQLRRLTERIIRDRALLTRLVGVGLLTREDAISYGAVGPFARASEVEVDVRRTASYAAFAEADFKVVPLIQTGGDVFSRMVVLLLEMVAGLAVARQVTQALPELDDIVARHQTQPVLHLSEVEVISRVEAPGGELLCYLRTGMDGRITSLRWRTPSQANMPLIPQLLTGQEIADVPLIMQSAYL